MKYLLILLVLFVGPAAADWEAREGNDRVRFIEKPCTNPTVLALVQKHGMQADKFSAAVAVVQGKSYEGCWTNRGLDVFLLYEDGDLGVVPREWVTKVESI